MASKIESLESLRKEYLIQMQLLQTSQSQSNPEQNALIRSLQAEKKDLLDTLQQEIVQRQHLEEMCLKLDKARKTLKEQMSFIRKENERVLDSVRKQFRIDLTSNIQTPNAPKLSRDVADNFDDLILNVPNAAQADDGNHMDDVINAIKADLREIAAISSPGLVNSNDQQDNFSNSPRSNEY